MFDPQLCPPSLAQCFDAPTDYRSVFGWLCGYSAEPLFLNEAIERFTRETKDQRAARGYFSMALMLDPGQRPIKPVEVPGLAHLPFGNASAPPFRLLHAKVALLAFRHGSENGRWLLRLIVSTGNWTRQTLEESLDVAWAIEIRSEELESDDDDLAMRCADIKAAWSTFSYLHKLYDLRVLDASRDHNVSETGITQNAVETWLNECAGPAGETVRYRDNREVAFLDQLRGAIEMHAPLTKRNYIAMGSGFFESASTEGEVQVPGVLDQIVSRLIDHGLLTKVPQVDLFVNPVACQAVATSRSALAARNWNIRTASPMQAIFGPNSQRTLHAKFLFSAQERTDDLTCHRPWVYLGSGNLTTPGFANRMSRHGGNLEACVVFVPEQLEWPQSEVTISQHAVNRFLPIQREVALGQTNALCAGSAMPPPGEPFIAPPLAWLAWHPSETGGHLLAPTSIDTCYEILDNTGQPCEKMDDHYVWLAPSPRQVRIRWMANELVHQCWIPVMDELGRLASTPLTGMRFDEAWSALENFPAAVTESEGADDGNEDGDDDDDDFDPAKPARPNGSSVAPYPVRQMMELVERIAERQTAVAAADWTAWCARLEQTLSRIADSPVLAYFHLLDLNPLSPLRASAFRPEFAETDATQQGLLYESVLSRVEALWKTSTLMPMEGTSE